MRISGLPKPFTTFFLYFLVLAPWSVAAADQSLVRVEQVREQPWSQTLTLYGTLTSPRDADVTPRVAGLVQKTHVDAGDRVAEGDLLISLDATLAKMRLRELEAAANRASAQLSEAKRLRAQAERLAAKGAFSQTETTARAAQVEVTRADLAELRAQAASQREMISRHTVLAPFDGVVRERLIEPGEYAAQATPVVELVAVDRLRMDVRAPQQYYRDILPGMAVTIRPDAYTNRSISAKVDVTVPAGDSRARTFLTRIMLANPGDQFVPGMSARVDFEITSENQVLVVSRDALVRRPGGGARVWVIESKDNHFIAQERQIKVGRGANGWVEVLEGLNPGSRVVVRGNESLGAGDRVRIEGENANEG